MNGKLVQAPFAGWVGTGGVSGGAARLGYVLTSDQNGVFRPRQPTDGVPLPVLATPRVIAEAGPHGIIPLQVEGEQIAARIVGTIRRFPSVDGDVVVADQHERRDDPRHALARARHDGRALGERAGRPPRPPPRRRSRSRRSRSCR